MASCCVRQDQRQRLPYCAGQLVCLHNSLATQAPQIASEWDYKVNEMTPANYTSKSCTKVAWKCSSCQHAWQAPIKRRTLLGSGCPMCGKESQRRKSKQPTLAASGPAVMAFWDHERNELAGLDPKRITLGSAKPVHWICNKCPLGLKHRWYASPNGRHFYKKPLGCPCCAGQKACKCNSLQTMYPEIAAEWYFAKNVTTPANHTAFSKDIAWWFNSKRGSSSWQQAVHARSCNACRNSKYSYTDK